MTNEELLNKLSGKIDTISHKFVIHEDFEKLSSKVDSIHEFMKNCPWRQATEKSAEEQVNEIIKNVKKNEGLDFFKKIPIKVWITIALLILSGIGIIDKYFIELILGK